MQGNAAKHTGLMRLLVRELLYWSPLVVLLVSPLGLLALERISGLPSWMKGLNAVPIYFVLLPLVTLIVGLQLVARLVPDLAPQLPFVFVYWAPLIVLLASSFGLVALKRFSRRPPWTERLVRPPFYFVSLPIATLLAGIEMLALSLLFVLSLLIFYGAYAIYNKPILLLLSSARSCSGFWLRPIRLKR
jgi:hypothetical protein